jgi:hypothetical protein
VDWNFYGNARMATYYVSQELNNNETTDLQWDLQSNSRIGATVKAENISARFEFGVSGTQGGGGSVSSRRIFGEWNFGSGKMKVGKDYTPVSQFVSGQVFDGDLGLLGVGTQYGNRESQIAFNFGGFNIALIQPSSALLAGMSTITTGALTVVTSGGRTAIDVSLKTDPNGTVQEIIPKIEASWGMSYDAWNFNLMGGFNYFSISDVESKTNVGDSNDIDVTSWTLGGDVGFNFGPGYVKAALSYGQNIGNAAWGLPSLAGGTSGQGGLAIWDGDDDTNDVDTFMGALVGGLKVSDMLSFEAGFGYRYDNTDGGDVRNTAPWAVYVQSVIALAPGVYVIPEVGYYDYDNNAAGNNQGSLFYLGGKWQINF